MFSGCNTALGLHGSLEEKWTVVPRLRRKYHKPIHVTNLWKYCLWKLELIQGVAMHSGMTFVNWRSDIYLPVSWKPCLTESSLVTPSTKTSTRQYITWDPLPILHLIHNGSGVFFTNVTVQWIAEWCVTQINTESILASEKFSHCCRIHFRIR